MGEGGCSPASRLSLRAVTEAGSRWSARLALHHQRRRALPVLDGRRENWFESWSFARLWQLGIEPPEPQVEVYDQDGLFLGRVDGLWLEEGVVAEADGSGKYLGEFDPAGPSGESAARAVMAEKVREDRIRDCGLEFVRWGGEEMAKNPKSVATQVRG